MNLLNKILPPPGTNPFFRSPGQAADVVTAPVRNMFGIPAVYEQLGNKIGNELKYAGGELLKGRYPYQVPSYGAIPPRDRYGESYRDAELRLSAAARAAGGPSAGGGIGGGNAASFVPYAGGGNRPTGADLAHAAETSRIAQLTAQDPELQRYEAARLKAVAPGATPETVQSAEDIGMQMWAKANPTLAAKVKPGQAGYDAIQGVLAGNAARSGFGFTTPQQLIPTPPPGVDIPQGLPAITSFTPAQTYGPKATEIDPELIKKFQSVLNLTSS